MQKIKAMIIGNKAEYVIDHGDYNKSRTMTFEAFQLDPSCNDALRIMACCSAKTDGATASQSLAEILSLKRSEWVKLANKSPGQLYKNADARSFIRFIFDLALINANARQLDSATYLLEETIRLDSDDHLGAADYLMAMYIRLMGLDNLQFTTIKRGVEHIKGLLNFKKPNGKGLYDYYSNVPRWANIFLYWYENDSENFSKAFNYELNMYGVSMNYLLGYEEHDISFPRAKEIQHYHKVNRQLRDAFFTWPDFVKTLQHGYGREVEKN